MICWEDRSFLFYHWQAWKTGYYTDRELQIQLPDRYKSVYFSRPDAQIVIAKGVLTIGEGFFFDGASGVAVDGVGNMLAALIHDALCRAKTLGATGYSYPDTHRMYRDVCIAQYEILLRAKLHYITLLVFNPIWRVFNG